MTRSGLLVVTALILFFGHAPADAQLSTEARRELMADVSNYAARVCTTVEQRGRISESQLGAEVRAETNSLAARVLRFGGTASGRIGSAEWEGLTQEALGAALTANMNCRRQVAERTMDRMLEIMFRPPPPAPPQPAPRYEPARPPPPPLPSPSSCSPFEVPATADNQTRMQAAQCSQRNQDACRALFRYFVAGCQMGMGSDQCCRADALARMGYR